MSKGFIHLLIWNDMSFGNNEVHLLESPEEMTRDDFKGLCDCLIESAAFNAIGNLRPDSCGVGWCDVVDELVKILVSEYDFKKLEEFEGKPVEYSGPILIGAKQYTREMRRRTCDCGSEQRRLLGSALRSILQVNRSISKEEEGN